MKGEGFDEFEDLASTDTFHDSDGVSGKMRKMTTKMMMVMVMAILAILGKGAI